MRAILTGVLTAAMGLLMASMGAPFTTWQYWAAIGICLALIIVNDLC